MKKFLIGSLLAIFWFASVYAVIQPDIRWWSTIVNPNPNNYFTVIQSGTSQGKISMANFANAISGSLNFVPRTAVDTGFNNTGSDTIIPSEKAVWSLVSWLNNNYVPYRSGGKFINSPFLFSTWIWGIDSPFYVRKWILWTYWFFSNISYTTGYDSTWSTLRAIKHNSWRAMWAESSAYSRGIVVARNSYGTYLVPTNYSAFAIWDKTSVEYSIDSNSGANFRIDYAWNVYSTGNLDVRGNISSSWDVNINSWNWFYFSDIARMGMSGNAISIQMYTGWVWVEKESFSND